MCNKKYFVSFILFSFLFFSCSNNSVEEVAEEDTIRSAAGKIEKSVSWTPALEEDILGTPLSRPENIGKNLDLTPVTYFVSRAMNPSALVYPSLEDFASLDLSLYSSESLKVLQDFCSVFCSSDENNDTTDISSVEGLMKSGSMYELFVFCHELKESSMPSFDSYIIGQPFVNDTVFQCPVRFDSTKGVKLDLFIYLEKEDSSWKISQISHM